MSSGRSVTIAERVCCLLGGVILFCRPVKTFAAEARCGSDDTCNEASFQQHANGGTTQSRFLLAFGERQMLILDHV